jgi:hypothetical protein
MKNKIVRIFGNIKLVGMIIAGTVFITSSVNSAGANPSPLSKYLNYRVSWKIVQKLGGLRVGDPYVERNGVKMLPVEFDPTGSRTITVAPTALNSCQGVRKLRAKVRGKEIHLSIWLSIFTRHRTCPVTKLGKIAPGEYEVWYDSANEPSVFIQRIRVP